MAQTQRIGVSLDFSANTSKLRGDLDSLQRQLSNILTTPTKKFALTDEVKGAVNAVAELKVHLQAATNVNTGKLDFSKLNHSLKQSGTTLSEYGQKLRSLGPQGQQAFQTLAQSIAAAEVPLKRSSKLLDGLWESLKNTVQWKISASVLEGFTGAIKNAYNYSQKLNSSLNNIRIVTGYSVDQMKDFAKEANAAAKALSTTTTEYTNASLIYFQQGLSTAEVKERTEATIKMANVTKESADTVSEQLTAVWNNFYDGTKSLEHYADVMTALGAATASSSSEISEGLNKFAAVAETVGLSYEYAASALATVTATTRESADIVGNAFKTLFARIEGLSLGETLDDGTTLNKYSEALNKVGINIKDQAGQMKDMDTILNEMGSKWGTMNKDQQLALAQTVAGVRQYTQLIALMDNWDYFQQNLNVANNSTGALDEQAKIAAESWEAARDRVTAAAESIYQKLLDDEWFISFLNNIEKVLGGVDSLVEKLGGMSGVLSTIGVLATKIFSKKLSEGISTIGYNLLMSTEMGRQHVQKQRVDFINEAVQFTQKDSNYATREEQAQEVSTKHSLELQSSLITNAERMSELELSINKTLIERSNILHEQYIEAARERDKKENERGDAVFNLGVAATAAAGTDTAKMKSNQNAVNKVVQRARVQAAAEEELRGVLAMLEKTKNTTIDTSQAFEILKKRLQENNLGKNYAGLEKFIKHLETGKLSATQMEQEITEMLAKMQKLQQDDRKNIEGLKVDPANYDALIAALKEEVAALKQEAEAWQKADQAKEDAEEGIKKSSTQVLTASEVIVKAAQGITGIFSVFSMLGGLVDTIKAPDVSGWEKFTAVFTNMAMIIPMVISTIKDFSDVTKSLIKGVKEGTIAKTVDTAAEWLNTLAKKANTRARHDNADAADREGKEALETAGEKGVESAVDTATSKGSGGAKSGKGLSGLKGGFKNLGGSIKSLASSAAPILGGAAMIAGGVAIIAGTIAIAYTQINKYNQAVEDAQAAAEMVSSAYQDIRQKYDDLAGQADTYHNMQDSLSGLTEGTLEYSQALVEANEASMELIKNNKELAGKYKIENGVIKIDEAALEELQRKELAKTFKAQANTILADNTVSEAEREKNTANAARAMHTAGDTGIAIGNTAVAGAAGAAGGALVAGGAATIIGALGTGAAAGSAAGPIGAAIGAAIGLIAGGITMAVNGAAQEAEMEALDDLSEYYNQGNKDIFDSQEKFFDAIKDLGISQDLANSLWENADATRSLVESNSALIDEEKAQYEAAFALYNTNNKQYQEFKNQDYLNKVAASNLSISTEEQEKINEGVDDLFSGSNDDFWAAYAKEVLGETEFDEGSTTGENYKFTDLGGGAVTLQKKNEDGTWETVGDENGLDEEAAAEQLKEARRMAAEAGKIGESIQQYQKQVEELYSAGLDSNNFALESILMNGTIAGNEIDLSGVNGYDLLQLDTSKISDTSYRTKLETAIQQWQNDLPSVIASDAYQQFYNSLSEEDKKLVWDISINEATSLESVQAALKVMQNYLDTTSLQISISATDKLVDLLEADAKDWDAIYAEYVKKDHQEILADNQWEINDEGKIVDANGNEVANKDVADKLSMSERQRIAASSTSQLIQELNQDQSKDLNELLLTSSTNVQDAAMAVDTVKQDNEQATIRIAQLEDEKLRNTQAVTASEERVSEAKGKLTSFNTDVASIDNFSELNYKRDMGTATEKELQVLDQYEALMKYTKENDLTAWTMASSDEQRVKLMQQAEQTPEYAEWLSKQGYSWFDTAGWTNAQNNLTIASTQYATNQNKLDTTTTELTNLQNADREGALAAAEDNYLQALQAEADTLTYLNQQSAKWNLDTDAINELSIYLTEIADESDVVADGIDKDRIVFARLTQGIVRQNKGLEDLNSNWDTYKTVLTNAETTSLEYGQTIQDLRTDLSNLLDLDMSQVNAEWLASKTTMDLVREAINGNEEAMAQLRTEAGLIAVTGATSIEALPHAYKEVYAWMENNPLPSLQIGVSEESTQYLLQLYQTLKDLGVAEKNIQTIIESQGFEWTGNASTSAYKGAPTLSASTLKEKEKSKKLAEDEIDRYHEIQEELDDINKGLDKITKAKERAFGANKLNYIDQEIAKTEQLINSEQRYLDQLQTDLITDRQKAWDIGIQTDNSGRIINYDEIKQQWLDAFNSGEIDEERYQKLNKILTQYENTLNSIEEQQEVVNEKHQELIDMALEKVQYEFEFKIKVDDAELRKLEYDFKKLDNPLFDTGDMIANFGLQAQSYTNKSQAAQQTIYDILGVGVTDEDMAAIRNGDFSVLDKYALSEDQISQIESAVDTLYEANEFFLDFHETVKSYLSEAFNTITEEINEQVDAVTTLGDTLKHYSNIVDLVGKDMLGVSDEIMTQLTQSIMHNAIDQVEANKIALNASKEMRDDLVNSYNAALAAGDTKGAEMYKDLIEQTDKTIEDQTKKLQGSIESALQAAADAFDSMSQQIISTFEKGLSGMWGSFDAMSEEYERQKAFNELYVADYDKIYQTSKMIRDVNKSINNTSSIKGKQELAALQEEMNALLNSEEQVSQYTLDHMQKRYELKVAEIALEEAQNAKSKVRMQRGADGAWSYVYTADEDKVAAAEQNYEDKLFAIQDLTQKYITECQDGIVQLQQQAAAALDALDPQDPQYEQKAQAIKDYYNKMMGYYSGELTVALDNSTKLYNEEWAKYEEISGYKRSDQQKWMSEFNETVLSQTTGFKTLDDYVATWSGSWDTAVSGMINNLSNWRDSVSGALEAGGLSLDTFADTLSNVSASVTAESEKIVDNLKYEVDIKTSGFNTFINEADKALQQYTEYISGMIGQNERLISSLNDVIKKQGEAKQSAATSYGISGGAGGGGNSTSSNGSNNGSNNGSSNSGAGEDLMSYSAIDISGYFNEDLSGSTKLLHFYKDAGPLVWNENWTKGRVELSGGWYYLPSSTARQIQHLASSVTTSSSFDTGGYTGSWDSSGRLAILHQKELILNAGETKDFLKALNILRSISGQTSLYDLENRINAQAELVQATLEHSNMMSQISDLIDANALAYQMHLVSSAINDVDKIAASIRPVSGEMLQNVTIHADFPGVSSRSEIVEAFNTLYNRAAQFANRKN